MEAETRARETQCKKLELLKLAESKVASRRSSQVGIAAKLRVAQALARLGRTSERTSERWSETGDEPPAAVPEDVSSAGSEEYEEFELPLRAMPLTLLGLDAAAAEARMQAGLPQAAPCASPRAPPADDATAAPKPPQPVDAIGTARPAAIGAVHAKMCEYALVGRLPLQVGASPTHPPR